MDMYDPMQVYEELGNLRRKYKITYKKLGQLSGLGLSRVHHVIDLVVPASLKPYPKIYRGMYKYAKGMENEAKKMVKQSKQLLTELYSFSPREFERCERDSDSVTDIK